LKNRENNIEQVNLIYKTIPVRLDSLSNFIGIVFLVSSIFIHIRLPKSTIHIALRYNSSGYIFSIR
jgi:predicted transporter